MASLLYKFLKNLLFCIGVQLIKEVGIPDHLTSLLRCLYAGQEAAVKTGHGTTDIPNQERSTLRLYIVTLLI